MNAVAEMSNDRPAVPRTAAEYSAWRLFYWSVRRELWENRSICWGPPLVALVMLAGFAVGARRLADGMRGFLLSDPDTLAMLTKPLSLIATPIIATGSLVALFYCLDALHGERRDRSILFWKSLPVSDFVTVLSKAVIPLVVLPVVICASFMALHLIVLVVGTFVLQAQGLDGMVFWRGVPLIGVWGRLAYGTFAGALWLAPVYGWVLLVSGWARRSTFLWAVLPPLALCLVERIAFGTNVALSLLRHRLFGLGGAAFQPGSHGEMVPDPLALLASPGLWIGLVATAVFLAAAVWLRRSRQPL